MNNLYALASILDGIKKNPSEKFDSEINKQTGLIDQQDAIKAKFRVFALFDDCIDEVSHLDLPPQRVSSMIVQIQSAKAKFLGSVNATTANDFSKSMQITHIVDLLFSFGDTLEASKKFGDAPLDRSDFSNKTVAMIETVQKSDIDPYSKSTLILKLQAVNRILIECVYMTDDQVRIRVKAIVADFHSSFTKHDKCHEAVSESLMRWASAIMKPGIFALALTADLSTVVALLPPPG